jgi:hypothetical protein
MKVPIGRLSHSLSFTTIVHPFPQAKLIHSLKTGFVIAAMRAGGIGAFPIPMKTISHVFRGANLFFLNKTSGCPKEGFFSPFSHDDYLGCAIATDNPRMDYIKIRAA